MKLKKKKHIFDIANLQFVLKTCNPTIKRAKMFHSNIYFRISLLPFAKQTYWCEKATHVLWFLCCSPVSKWLLYRQRGAVCCKMLLRHNWVRFVYSKRARVFRTFLARVFPTIDTGDFTRFWRFLKVKIRRKTVDGACVEGNINRVVYSGCRLLCWLALTTAVIP